MLVASCLLLTSSVLKGQSDRASVLIAAYEHAVTRIIPGSGPVVLNLHVTQGKADVALSPNEKAEIGKSIRVRLGPTPI